MAVKLRATSPVYCGRCGKRRGLVHTCIVRQPSGKTRVKSPAVFKCPRCGQEYGNPLSHVCSPRRGDFKRRKARAERAERQRKAAQLRAERRAERAAKPAGGGQRSGHDYRTCQDDDCQRMTCRVHKEGFASGYDTGHAKGEAVGHSLGYGEGSRDGHREGWRDGIAAAARASR